MEGDQEEYADYDEEEDSLGDFYDSSDDSSDDYYYSSSDDYDTPELRSWLESYYE